MGCFSTTRICPVGCCKTAPLGRRMMGTSYGFFVFSHQGNIDSGKMPTGSIVYFYLLGGGFKYFLFSHLFGEDSHFDWYFSNGLKPLTSCISTYFYHQNQLHADCIDIPIHWSYWHCNENLPWMHTCHSDDEDGTDFQPICLFTEG